MTPVRFRCLPGCTNCCDQKGYVYLTESDLRSAASFLKMQPAEFERRYVYRTRHLLRLRKPRGSQCHFLQDRGCAIHPEKPTQCRAFPFWPELVGNRKAWREAARYCPGIGKGKLISVESLVHTANGMREAYPAIYERT